VDSLPVVRPVEADDLGTLEKNLPRDHPNVHRERYRMQTRGKGLHAIAWYGNEPVGSLFVYWEGPGGSLLTYWIGPGAELVRETFANCPVLIDLYVLPEYRRMGIATHLLDYVEAEARQQGFRRIGLNVGDLSDPDYKIAHGIYIKRGYRDSGLGGHTESYKVLGRDGKEVLIEESVIFMVKEFQS